MISFTCPHCGKACKAPPEFAGRRAICGRCKKTFLVPEQQESSLDPDEPSVTELFEEPVQFETSKRRKLFNTLLIAVALIAMITVAIVVIAFSASRSEEEKPNAKKPAPDKSILDNSRLGKPQDTENDFGKKFKDALFGGVTIAVVLFIFFVMLAYIVLVVAVMIWTARDADNRGHEGALWAMIYAFPQLLWFTFPILLLIPVIGWLLFPGTFIASWLGLIVYLFARRRGVLKGCTHCGNKHLEYVKSCPHCGASNTQFMKIES